MNYYANLAALEDKLTATLNDEGLVFALDTSKYPITLTVSHDTSVEAQMELFSALDSVSSTDAMMKFIFKLDALEIRVDNRFIISDALMSKIKGQAKKIHHAFLEGFFAERINYQSSKNEPVEAACDAPAEIEPDEFADFFDDDQQDTAFEETTSPEDTEGNE